MTLRTPPRLPALVPTGSARAWFLGGGGQPSNFADGSPGAATATGSDRHPNHRPDRFTKGDDGDDPLGRGLRAALTAHDVPDQVLWLAWEVTTWIAAVPLADRRALACLVVGVLMAVEAGGTYLPLGLDPQPAPGSNDAPGGPLSAALTGLGVGEADRIAACGLARKLADGTALLEIAGLVGGPDARRPFVMADGALYPERLWRQEERLVTRLRARLTSTPAPLSTVGQAQEAVAAIAAQPGAPPLSDQQKAAICAAVIRPLTIVAGGPGTGKTSTVVALLRALVRLGVSPKQIALAAPTGRAAQRMSESVDGSLARLTPAAPWDVTLVAEFAGATTIHRLLGIRSTGQRPFEPDIPEFYRDWPLPLQVVIVDEASMIDLALMDRLCDAIAPQARLILIGDVDQLPSVEVGAVFRDLVTAAPQITHALTRSHRMNPADPAGAEILAVAQAVNAGAPANIMPAARARAADLALSGFERLGPGLLDDFLDRWYAEALGAPAHFEAALDRRFLLDDANRIAAASRAGGDDPGNDRAQDVLLVGTLLDRLLASRILCLTRTAGRTSSTAAINRLLHGRVQSAAIARGADQATALAAFLPGEPVIVLRNDPSRRLANGDLGMVLRVHGARGETMGVAFAQSDGIVVHPLDAIVTHLALAFALTVHKAQGSEYERAALILPEVDVPLLTREVLYTALTRARRGLVVVGDLALFNLGAGRTLTRTSGIVQKLRDGILPAAPTAP